MKALLVILLATLAGDWHGGLWLDSAFSSDADSVHVALTASSAQFSIGGQPLTTTLDSLTTSSAAFHSTYYDGSVWSFFAIRDTSGAVSALETLRGAFDIRLPDGTWYCPYSLHGVWMGVQWQADSTVYVGEFKNPQQHAGVWMVQRDVPVMFVGPHP